MRIKAYTGYDERTNKRYYRYFDVVDELPAIGETFEREKVIAVEPVQLDYEQGSDEVYDYDYYMVTTVYREEDEEEESYYYIAVER